MGVGARGADVSLQESVSYRLTISSSSVVVDLTLPVTWNLSVLLATRQFMGLPNGNTGRRARGVEGKHTHHWFINSQVNCPVVCLILFYER